MARYRYTIAAAVLFIGLLVWVLLNERGRVPESGEVFGLDIKNVTRFEISPRDGKPVTFEKRGDQWWVTAPFQGWANKDEVERIAKGICELKPSKRPDADPKSKEFGLDNPFVTARVFVGSRKYEIALGNEAPVGGENFAYVTGEKGVFIVPAFLKTDLMKKPEDLRDRKLCHYTKEDVVSLDLQNEKGAFHIDGLRQPRSLGRRRYPYRQARRGRGQVLRGSPQRPRLDRPRQAFGEALAQAQGRQGRHDLPRRPGPQVRPARQCSGHAFGPLGQ